MARTAAPRKPQPPPLLLVWCAAAILSIAPWSTPALALALGAALALTLGNPWLTTTTTLARWLLQGSIVGLGFGIPLAAVVAAGAAGIGYTLAGIVAALALGLTLGRLISVDRETSWLISVGTAICGGSAIAAVGFAISARRESMSVALGTVFLLNAAALYLFPPLGHALEMSDAQFAVWAAVAIHDTSSVVGAALEFGRGALEPATVLKLARALWIVPLTLVAAYTARRHPGPTAAAGEPGRMPKVSVPWFIVLFLLAALIRSQAGTGAEALLDSVASVARVGLTLTLFLIGAGLTRSTLRTIGFRPFLQGVGLWIAVAGLTLGLVLLSPGL